MNMHINVVKKGANTKPAGHACPWIMDVPPEAEQK